jgi:hypothetical protein
MVLATSATESDRTWFAVQCPGGSGRGYSFFARLAAHGICVGKPATWCGPGDLPVTVSLNRFVGMYSKALDTAAHRLAKAWLATLRSKGVQIGKVDLFASGP